LREVDDVVCVLRFDAILFFFETQQPGLSVGVRRSESGEERTWTFAEKAGSANEVGGGVPNEATDAVTGIEDALCTQLGPCSWKIGERNTPVGMFLVDMGFVAEAVRTVGRFGEIPFVILAFVIECDFRVEAKEGREEV
jgi:hypothetical protein